MKYLEEFLRYKYKIQPLGKLTWEEYQDVQDGGIVGVEIKIDDFSPGIVVWYADYSDWLEQQYDNLMETYLKLNPNAIDIQSKSDL